MTEKTGKEMAEEIAKEIVNAQPMSDEACKAFYSLYKSSKSRKWLTENGYEPVEKAGQSLMWIKKDG